MSSNHISRYRIKSFLEAFATNRNILMNVLWQANIPDQRVRLFVIQDPNSECNDDSMKNSIDNLNIARATIIMDDGGSAIQNSV